jgi:hypothetical protein
VQRICDPLYNVVFGKTLAASRDRIQSSRLNRSGSVVPAQSS